MRLVVILLALALAGCASSPDVIGGGKPTTLKCKGKMTVSGGPYVLLVDCPPEGGEFSINVR